MDVDRLESVAAQLAARVREDDPEANRRWLHANTTPEEREALHYVQAAATPVDVPWSHLIAWTRIPGGPDTPGNVAKRRRELLDALDSQVGNNQHGPKVA